MRNIKLTIEYDGSDFNGWQRQSKIKELNYISKSVKYAQTIVISSV